MAGPMNTGPFHVHYAETFIVPANAGRYTVRPAEASGRCAGVCEE